MKEKIRVAVLGAGRDGRMAGDGGTLWGIYGGLVPVYARFGANARKNNFANVIMPINGVNIALGSKFADRQA